MKTIQIEIPEGKRAEYVTPWTLYFKSHKLAEYAAKQFRDIYADFCDCKKGSEK